MLDNADILIVGGGIIGCALLYELSKTMPEKIILVEQGQLASETTGQSGGFIRKVEVDPLISQLASDSFDYYQHFNNEVGETCGFVKTGFTYRLPYQTLLEIEKNISKLQALDYPINIVNESQDAAFIYEPNAGYIDTKLTCNSWVQAAKKMGAICYENVLVENFLIHDGCVYGVNTTQGIITSKRIIIATGFLSQKMLSLLGINVPICVNSFQYNVYSQVAHHLKTAYLDLINQFYLLPLGNGDVLAGFLNDDKIIIDNNFDQQLDKSSAFSLHQLISQYFPWIDQKSFEIKKSHDAFTSDQYGVMNHSQLNGLFLATGLNGGGIKIAPAMAKKIVQIIKES